MAWKQMYAHKIVTAEEAVKHIKSNDRLVLGHAAAEPLPLTDAMVANKDQYENVEIIHFVPMGKSEYCKPEMENYFTHNSFFLGGNTREAIASGRGRFTPAFLHESVNFFKTTLQPDVALFQVSPPDEHGYCSFGISVDFTKPAAESARLKIAEINDIFPRTLGDTFIHISDIDYLVPTSRPLIEIMPTDIGEVERAIGENCASIIEDGSAIQMGIGAIPDAVLLFLDNKKDLGIHTEMLSTGVVRLVKQGVINNRLKTTHSGKITATFVMGTQELYDFAENNPMVELYPADYINDPVLISRNDKVVSICSCIQIDFTGQVCAESIGPKQFSGTGGQVDFFRGANMSKGGKAITAISSTTANGKISRIVPFLDYGSVVTSTRNDVNYVVTEYGIAQLKGKTTRNRARALINIAHPKFRPELISQFEEIFKCVF